MITSVKDVAPDLAHPCPRSPAFFLFLFLLSLVSPSGAQYVSHICALPPVTDTDRKKGGQYRDQPIWPSLKLPQLPTDYGPVTYLKIADSISAYCLVLLWGLDKLIWINWSGQFWHRANSQKMFAMIIICVYVDPCKQIWYFQLSLNVSSKTNKNPQCQHRGPDTVSQCHVSYWEQQDRDGAGGGREEWCSWSKSLQRKGNGNRSPDLGSLFPRSKGNKPKRTVSWWVWVRLSSESRSLAKVPMVNLEVRLSCVVLYEEEPGMLLRRHLSGVDSKLRLRRHRYDGGICMQSACSAFKSYPRLPQHAPRGRGSAIRPLFSSTRRSQNSLSLADPYKDP